MSRSTWIGIGIFYFGWLMFWAWLFDANWMTTIKTFALSSLLFGFCQGLGRMYFSLSSGDQND